MLGTLKNSLMVPLVCQDNTVCTALYPEKITYARRSGKSLT